MLTDTCFHAFKPLFVHTCVYLLNMHNVNAVKISVKIPGSLRCYDRKMLYFLKGGYWTSGPLKH